MGSWDHLAVYGEGALGPVWHGNAQGQWLRRSRSAVFPVMAKPGETNVGNWAVAACDDSSHVARFCVMKMEEREAEEEERERCEVLQEAMIIYKHTTELSNNLQEAGLCMHSSAQSVQRAGEVTRGVCTRAGTGSARVSWARLDGRGW